jgi:long-chain acyl-CoA synthetase
VDHTVALAPARAGGRHGCGAVAMNLASLLNRTAAVFPGRPAILVGRQLVCDYRGLARRAGALARGLTTRLGLVPGDRVGLYMTNGPQYLEVLYGAWIAGLAAVPINAKLHPKEVAWILEDSATSVLFASADLAGDIPAGAAPSLRAIVATDGADYDRLVSGDALAQVDRAPGDLAWLFYTSGTTGRPKGVMITHRNLLAMTLCYFADVDAAARDDAIVYAAPMSHGAGLYNFPHVRVGARHVIPESGGFDAAEILELARVHRNVSMFAAPTMVKRLVDHGERAGAGGDGIKTIVYGGGPMYAQDIKHALAVLGERFVQIYGQGESPMTITALARVHLADRAHPRYEARIASVGVAQSAVEVRVADEAGRPLPAGEAGEVLVRGDTVMAGYWRNPEATARTIRDGWLFTGDVGALDADGFLTLKDRSKDVIITGGSNVYPREVEEVLLLDPGVLEVSVVGRPHPEWGEEVVAFVVRRAGAMVGDAELDALCLAHIARFKRPKAYRFVDALPKNNYGKVLKTELRERLRGEAEGS